jgi:hypothetical protein
MIGVPDEPGLPPPGGFGRRCTSLSGTPEEIGLSGTPEEIGFLGFLLPQFEWEHPPSYGSSRHRAQASLALDILPLVRSEYTQHL